MATALRPRSGLAVARRNRTRKAALRRAVVDFAWGVGIVACWLVAFGYVAAVR